MPREQGRGLGKRILFGSLLVLIGVLVVGVQALIWADRAVFNSDQFVDTVGAVYQDPVVQQKISNDVAAAILDLDSVSQYIDQFTPEDMSFLKVPISLAVHRALQEATLAAMAALEPVMRTALYALHGQLVTLLERGVSVINPQGELVLDMKALIVNVLENFGLNPSGALFDRLNLPEDAGQIVILEQSQYTWAWWVASYAYRLTFWITIALLVILVAAIVVDILVAPTRRRGMVAVGAVVAGSTALFLLFILPTQGNTQAASDQPILSATVTALSDSFKNQSMFFIMGGVALGAGASLSGRLGGLRRVRTARGRRRKATTAVVEADAEHVSFGEWVRTHSRVLRALGLGLAGLVMLGWPTPSLRVNMVTLTLLAVYLIVVGALSSDAGWARALRSEGVRLWDQHFRIVAPGPASGSVLQWLARRWAWFRVVGLGVGLAVLAFWPSLTLTLAAGVIGLMLLYLALIDLVTSMQKG